MNSIVILVTFDIIGQKFLMEAKLELRAAPHLFRAVLLPVTSVDYGTDDAT